MSAAVLPSDTAGAARVAGAALSHRTVLRDEAVAALLGHAGGARPEGLYVDGTFGRGGHARAVLQALGPQGRLVGFDKDPEAVAEGQALAAQDPRFTMVHASFAAMAQWLRDAAPRDAQGQPRVDGVLLDLGVSSPQLDDPVRGFSFRADAPLDMRMDSAGDDPTAADFLAQAPERRITEVLRDYGEERFAARIAKAVVARRESGNPVRRTAELAALVAGEVKTREPGQNPATRTFQALRILVNRELEDLQEGLNAALALLAPGGRLAVISFHSLEDRIVKRFIASNSRIEVDRRAPFIEPPPAPLRAVARIFPSEAEVAANPRARSAVLRVAERNDAPLPVAHAAATAGGPASRRGGRR